jgi:hypothetical protein
VKPDGDPLGVATGETEGQVRFGEHQQALVLFAPEWRRPHVAG